MLTLPPLTTNPSLAAGDPVRNDILTLAMQLKRVEAIPQIKPTHIPASPRVDALFLPTQSSPHVLSPRVRKKR